MSISWLTAMLDVPANRFEPTRHFWEEATAMHAAGEPNRQDGAILAPSVGDAYLAMQRASPYPGGCRLVLHVDDPAGVSQRAVELGARVQRHGSYAIEMHSPGGLLFSITAWSGESHRPPPASWPAGQRSLVDQVCIDIPPSTYDRECDFWAHITGAEPLPGGRPEFRYLPRAPGMPLRLLLQRLLDAPAATASAHLDLACSDKAVEVRRHEALGATVAHEGPVWTTLRDPAAIAYCITDRDPDSGTLASNLP